MMKFLLSPNLPSGNVKKIICGTTDRKILDFFFANGIEVISFRQNNNIDVSVSTHADMAALHIGEDRIIIDKYQSELKYSLSDIGFTVFETVDEVNGKYPYDVRLNFTVIGNAVVGNHKYADSKLFELISDKKIIKVNQGYSKCSTLVVNEKVIITDDESIFKKTSENGIEALLISKGDISLDGHEYGFIGGASGKISKDTVVFFGDITKHRDFNQIASFLSEHGCCFVCSDDGPLRDIGGIIPLLEVQF